MRERRDADAGANQNIHIVEEALHGFEQHGLFLMRPGNTFRGHLQRRFIIGDNVGPKLVLMVLIALTVARDKELAT